ncbi:MAG: SDR family oxidoreductase [Patescibacteria group bacterium]|nr:SDR family oxidoreductase [Patescibacteria group bacterium]
MKSDLLSSITPVALVTGGSKDIGAAVAIRLAEAGYDIAVTYHHDRDGAQETVRRVQELGRRANAIAADLVQEVDCERTIRETMQQFGRLDVLINNAGGSRKGDTWDGEPAVWHDVFMVNIISVLQLSKLAIRHFREQGNGTIVNVSSRFGLAGDPVRIAYAASKAALINITKSLAKELAPLGRCNCVAPGATAAGYWKQVADATDAEVEKIPLKTINTPDDVANTILFLATDQSRTMTGQTVVIDGGYLLR